MDFKTRFTLVWLVQIGLGFTFGSIQGNPLGGLVFGTVFGIPSSFVMIKLMDIFSGAGSSLFTGKGGEAPMGYSTENAMAQRGERDEACQALYLRGQAGDDGALHALIVIASKGPVLGAWVVKAAQMLLQRKDLNPENQEHFTRLIAEYSALAEQR